MPLFSRKYTMNQAASRGLKSSGSEDATDEVVSAKKPAGIDNFFKYQEADTIKELLKRKYKLFNNNGGSSTSHLGVKRKPLYNTRNV